MPQEVRVPRLGWSMEEGIFVRWLKQPGDSVAAGELLFEIEGDKALQEIEAVDAGVLYIPPDAPQPGSAVLVGAVLGYLLAPGEPIPESKPEGAPTDTAEPGTSVDDNQPPVASPAVRRLARKLGVDLSDVMASGVGGRVSASDIELHAEAQQLAESASRSMPRVKPLAVARTLVATPRAKRLAGELGVDWTSVQGTGRDGRIREVDIRNARQVARRPSAAAGPTATRGPAGMSPRRKAIAERLRAGHARTVPVTLTTVADATNLVALREQFKSHPSGIVPTYADIIACLAAGVLRRHPMLAVCWDDGHNALLPADAEAIHVGIAVDTPDGLLVPVVQDVLKKSLVQVARESHELAEQARAGRLKGPDMRGGAMTISNLGAYGIDAFTPVINEPQVSILGLGAIRREPVVLPDDRIVPRDRITLSLTFDHAAVDGAPAAALLRDIAAAIENPAAHLLAG